MHVPQSLQHYFGCDQIRISLKTSLKKSAAKICAAYEAEVIELFAKLERHIRTGNVYASQREVDEAVSHYRPSRAARAEVITLKKLVEEYFEAAKVRWSVKTGSEIHSSLIHMTEFLGENRNCRDIRVSDAKLLLKELLVRLEPGTTNDRLCRIRNMFKYAKTSQYITENPFTEIKAEEKGKKSTIAKKDIKLPFSDVMACSIFEKICNPVKDKDYPLFWVPYIAAYSGMRKDEICQLHRDNIVEIDGIKCFAVIDHREEQKVKTINSRRFVPIHSRLIELGFLDYLESLPELYKKYNDKEYPDRVFPMLKRQLYDFGHSFRNFDRRLRRYITKDERYVLHSFRHSVATKLTDLDFNSVKKADLLGHERGGDIITDTIYAGTSRVSELKKLVEAIKYIPF
jgi:site-specific recombinase XerD